MSTALILLPTATLSTYALYLSYQNITRLQQYEAKSEKAAEWSSTAAERLSKTRATQTSGTVYIITSLLSSSLLLILPTHNTTSTSTSLSHPATALANALLAFLAHRHMAAFWNEKQQTRIPFVDAFNEAIRGSEQVVLLIGTLAVGWATAGAVWVGVQQGFVGSVLGTVVWSCAVGVRAWYVGKVGWGL